MYTCSYAAVCSTSIVAIYYHCIFTVPIPTTYYDSVVCGGEGGALLSAVSVAVDMDDSMVD